MAPSKEKGSAVSIRLPMELWWLVIETLAASGEQFELIYLEEVDSTFGKAREDITELTDIYRHV
jgi:hypothetical protein